MTLVMLKERGTATEGLTPHEIPCLIKGAMGNDGNIYFAGVG